MNHDYVLSFEMNDKKRININFFQMIKDLTIFLSSSYVLAFYIILFPYFDHIVLTYIIGSLIGLTLMPITIKLAIKFLLSITLGFFIDINYLISKFSFGFTFFIVGFLLFSIYLIINIMTLFTFSIATLSIGSCLLISM